MKASKSPFDKFYALLAQMPNADKEDLIWQFSNMATISLKEFYAKQPENYKRMIAAMQAEVNKQNGQNVEVKQLRSAILNRLQRYGVDTTSWARVNQFLQQPRIAGKRLYEMSIGEMRDLIPKLEMILQKAEKAKEKELELTIKN